MINHEQESMGGSTAPVDMTNRVAELSVVETVEAVNKLYERGAFVADHHIRTLLLDEPEQDILTTQKVSELIDRVDRAGRPRDPMYTTLLGVFSLTSMGVKLEDVNNAVEFHIRNSVSALDADKENVFYRMAHGSELAVVGTEESAQQVIRAIATARANKVYQSVDLTLNNMGRSQGGKAHRLTSYQLQGLNRSIYNGN